MTPQEILVALTMLLSQEPNPAFDVLRQGGHDPRYPIEVTACPETTAPLDIEGHTVLCGSVSVPENYDQPEGNRVPLRFVVGSARSTNPFPDPIIYLHGGPAGGALDSIGVATDVILGNHRAHRDVVTFDQRGAMISSTTVRCYEEMAENIVEIARTIDGVTPPDGQEALDLEAVYAPCIAELYGSDADLSQYNTENNARDVRALMSALGYPEYNILGISYGTRLSLEVLRTAPEGVRSVIIDGVAPPTVKLYDDLWAPHVDAMDALFEQCAADERCDEAYPDLREKFTALPEAMQANPVPAARGRVPVTPEVFYSIVDARTRYSETWVRQLNNYLPRMIYELSEGNPTTFDWYIDTFGEDQPADPVATVQAAGDLTDDERALAMTIARAALATNDTQTGVSEAFAQLKHDLVVGEEGLSVAEAFDARASEILQNLSRPDAVAAIRDYALFQTREPTKQTLVDWVNAHITGTDNSLLLELVDAMNADDVERTFQIADNELSPYQKAIQSTLGLFIYACQEDFPYNTLQGYRASNETVPYSIILESADAFESVFETCGLFEAVPRQGFQTPVSSDVPVLSLGGTNDTQTSWTWSALAAETLPNSQVIIFPNAGHGSSLYSQCGMDIAAKFIIDPDAEIDTSCVGELVPNWVMPDGPLQ